MYTLVLKKVFFLSLNVFVNNFVSQTRRKIFRLQHMYVSWLFVQKGLTLFVQILNYGFLYENRTF